jgi:hypothetical protein
LRPLVKVTGESPEAKKINLQAKVQKSSISNETQSNQEGSPSKSMEEDLPIKLKVT